MRRIVPDFITALWDTHDVPRSREPLPTYGPNDWSKLPSLYRSEARAPDVDYVWLEYAMDAPASVTVSVYDFETTASDTMDVSDADMVRHKLEQAGWTLQFRTSHKEGFSYLYGRRKA